MRWYNRYGPVVRRYQGTCQFGNDEPAFGGPFELVQIANGAMYLRLLARGNVSAAAEYLNPPMLPEGTRLYGTTKDGLPIAVEPYSVLNVDGQLALEADLELRFAVMRATIGDTQATGTRSRYGLVNVRFAANKWKLRKHSQHQFMEIHVPSHGDVIIEPVRGYKELEMQLRAQQGSALTCTAMTSISPAAFEQLCHILSFAQGTILNWVWRADYSGRHRVQTQLENRITRPYSNLQPLPTQEPHVIPEFVSKTWDKFAAAAEPYKLVSVTRMLAEARRGLDSDLEARGILLAVVLELLLASFGREEELTWRMPQELFEEGIDVWKPDVKQALERAYPASDAIGGMVGYLDGLNRTTFRKRLREMSAKVRPDMERGLMEQEIDRVVEIRNDLIHEARYPSDDRDSMINDCFFLLTFVDQLVLKLIGYSGRYNAFLDGNFRIQELK